MAVKIGFDDDPNLLPKLDEDSDEIVHGDGYKEKKYQPVKIPERRKAQILEEFKVVVVRDYGDDYHLSEEEATSIVEEASDAVYTRKLEAVVEGKTYIDESSNQMNQNDMLPEEEVLFQN